MLNHKTIFKQKSKILLIILSIFGLLFSYSCSCRADKVTGGRYNGKGGTASGNWTMQLTSDGKGYKQEATISFEKATATLKSVTDVDSGITIEDGDFVYEGNTLKLKKDTTDPSVIDTTTAAKITWDGTTVKKVKATFTLTPSASDVDLDATEKEVVISIKKIKKIDSSNFESVLQKMEGGDFTLETGSPPSVAQATFNLSKGTYSQTGIYKIENAYVPTGQNTKLDSFTDAHLAKMHEYADFYLPYLEAIKTATISDRLGGVGSAYYTITYSIVFADDFESDSINTVKINFVGKE